MSSKEGDEPGSLEPPLKKPKVEQKANQEEDQQLIERKWVKVDGSEEQKNPRVFKVMQWNSLADGLAHTTFIHCPAEFLQWSFRGPLILQEILRSGADIVCMEEVDHFDDFLRPKLEENGFSGLFVEKKNSPCLQYKPNNGPDGCALFYRSSKLLLVKKKELVLEREDGTRSSQVALMLQLRFVDDDALECSENKPETDPDATPCSSSSTQDVKQTICIAVTHLKAKRESTERRTAQGKHLLSELASFSENNPVIICGDFNATPDEPVYEYFSGNSKPPLKLCSSYVTPHYGGQEPPLTSWKFRTAGESKYTIDYIWFTPATMKVDSIWTVPTEEEIGKGGLPCKKYPSDHVSICTCFRLYCNL